jgi:hypothetical protein
VSSSPCRIEDGHPAGGAVDLDGVVAAAAGCPAVAGLSTGTFGEVATYLPGRRVGGIRITDTDVEIHVVARHGQPLPQVTAQIAAATGPLIGARRLTVVVDDLDVDFPDPSRSTSTPSGSE